MKGKRWPEAISAAATSQTTKRGKGGWFKARTPRTKTGEGCVRGQSVYRKSAERTEDCNKESSNRKTEEHLPEHTFYAFCPSVVYRDPGGEKGNKPNREREGQRGGKGSHRIRRSESYHGKRAGERGKGGETHQNSRAGRIPLQRLCRLYRGDTRKKKKKVPDGDQRKTNSVCS